MPPRVTDDIVWVPELEMAIDFQGTWMTQVLSPPPFTVLRGECLDAPVSLEIYALDPEEFRHIDSVGRDLVHSRLTRVSAERYDETPKGLDAHAAGLERGRPTELTAAITFDNDAYYVMAFSADPGVLEVELWRVQAMISATTYGRHESYGKGLGGLVNLMGAHLSEPQVIMGQSRAQLGFLRRPHRPGPPPIPPRQTPSDKVVVDPQLLTFPQGPPPIPAQPRTSGVEDGALSDFERQLTGVDEEAPLQEGRVPSLRSVVDRDDLADFEARLKAGADEPLADEEAPTSASSWPAPWEPLPTLRPGYGTVPRPEVPLALTASAMRTRRAQEIIAFAESLPAQIGFHAEKIYGVGESLSHRAEEPFSVVGLERVPMLLEAMLSARQSALSMQEVLAVDLPRRAFSRLGRQAPRGGVFALSEALEAMCRDDDDTAADLIGWRLGWRHLQARLPVFGLFHHSILIPARARTMAYTDLDGPLQGLDLEARIELWRHSSEDERRQLLGQLHKANLETPLERIGEAFVEMATSRSQPAWARARWALALGPRGCAQEYAGLMSALVRGEVLGVPHNAQAIARMSPCVGDHLSGLVPGVDLGLGKLGQTFGALNGVGVLKGLKGTEVAICVLAKQIETEDHGALSEQLRILSAQIYLHVARS